MQMESSPTSFHTVKEFQSPSSFPSWSDFEGFSDSDNCPLQSSSLSSTALVAPSTPPTTPAPPLIPTTAPTPPSISPTAPTPPSIPPTALAAPPTYNLDNSLRTFPSSEDTLSFCQSWARDCGYAIRNRRTKSRRKEKTVYKIYFECECAGKKQGSKIPEQYRIRKDQASKACGCPFKGSVTEKDGSWSIQISHPDHANHLPFLQPGDSAIHRRAARAAYPELLQQVQINVQNGIQPKKAMDDWLLKDPAAPVILKDMYNLFASTKKEQDGGLPPIQALFSKLQKNDRFLYDYSTDHLA